MGRLYIRLQPSGYRHRATRLDRAANRLLHTSEQRPDPGALSHTGDRIVVVHALQSVEHFALLGVFLALVDALLLLARFDLCALLLGLVALCVIRILLLVGEDALL